MVVIYALLIAYYTCNSVKFGLKVLLRVKELTFRNSENNQTVAKQTPIQTNNKNQEPTYL